MKTAGCCLLVDRLEAVERRHDIEKRRPGDPVAMVAQQPVRDPLPAVVAGEEETRVAKALHDLDHVLGHDAKAVVDEIGAGLGQR